MAKASVTKSEAIRKAIASGAEQPAAGVAYIKNNFGLDVTPTHFSAVKSSDAKKTGRITINRKRGRPKGVSGTTVLASGDSVGNGLLASMPRKSKEGDMLTALEALKPLVKTLGADKVKRIADLLG